MQISRRRINIPSARCLGVQHATLALEKDMACSIRAAFQPRVKENRLERATKASSASSVAGPSAALGAPEPLLHDLSHDPVLDIPDAQASRSHSPSPQARRVKCSRQARDIMDLKAQMAQVLELLAKQATASQAAVPAPLQPQLPYTPSPRGDQSGWDEAYQLVQEDTLSVEASGEGASFSSDMQVGGELEPPAEEEPGFEVASDASAPPLSSTYGMRCSLPAGFLDTSGRTTPVRFPSMQGVRNASQAGVCSRGSGNSPVKHGECARGLYGRCTA
ncbi:UNVERIFIED_CONTAM: hypothetical protein FKN15_077225 [Acipenser sinensis]